MFGNETGIEHMFKSAELNRLKRESASYRYVWLNLDTGEFSNSWGEEDQKLLGGDKVSLDGAKAGNWKLIKYQCLTDKEFEFYNMMKLK